MLDPQLYHRGNGGDVNYHFLSHDLFGPATLHILEVAYLDVRGRETRSSHACLKIACVCQSLDGCSREVLLHWTAGGLFPLRATLIPVYFPVDECLLEHRRVPYRRSWVLARHSVPLPKLATLGF